MIQPDQVYAATMSRNYDQNVRLATTYVKQLPGVGDKPDTELSRGLAAYALSRGFPVDKLSTDQGIEVMTSWKEGLLALSDGAGIHNRNNYIFPHAPVDLITLRDSALTAAALTSNFIGTSEIFAKRTDRSDRLTRFAADIDDDLYVSLKGSTGVGNFAVDLAIGKTNSEDWGRSKGEMWRVGFDIVELEGKKVFRFLRAGSAMTNRKIGHEEKQNVAKEFRKRYGVSVGRALGLSLMFIAHSDPEVEKIMAPTNGVFHDPLQSLGRSRGSIKFDYQGYWKRLGFTGCDAHGWMSLCTRRTHSTSRQLTMIDQG